VISVDSLLPDSTIYFISFTFRSGTNLLCDYLSANGLGFPAEYFQHPYGERNRELFEELDIQNNDLATYLERLLLRRSRNGVFGAKMAWDHRNFLVEEIAKRFPGLTELENVFPSAKWIHSERRDKIGQAISLWRAHNTGKWDSQSSASAADPRYDYYALFTCFFSILASDYIWKDYFARYNLQPLVVVYEHFIEQPRKTVADLYRFIKNEDLAEPENIVIKSILEVQRDRYSESIRERFVEDLDHLGAQDYWAPRKTQVERWNEFHFKTGWAL
jgi:LPS sulfotransferase NodH